MQTTRQLELLNSNIGQLSQATLRAPVSPTRLIQELRCAALKEW
jgi:hypothetical protein